MTGLQEHNRLFPESAYDFKGFMFGRMQQEAESLMPVYSQPYYRELTTTSAIDTLGISEGKASTVEEAYAAKVQNVSDVDERAKLDAARWILTEPHARTEVTLSEVVSYMKKKGLEVKPSWTGGLWTGDSDPDYALRNIEFWEPGTGVIVSDLVQRNFIRNEYGDIVCIDPLISLEGKSQERRAQEALAALAMLEKA
jgi:hypothetical protein